MEMTGNSTLYDRILEGIDDGIAQALSRRKGEGVSVSGNGKEMSVPKDASSYEKHTKDWFLVRDFISGTFGKFRTDRDYSALSPGEMALICRIFSGKTEDAVISIAGEAGIAAEMRPRNGKETEAMVRLFPDLGWTGMLGNEPALTYLDSRCAERPVYDFREGDDIAFIKIARRDGSAMLLPADWAKRYINLPWQREMKVICPDACVSPDIMKDANLYGTDDMSLLHDGFGRTRDTLREAYYGKDMAYWKWIAERRHFGLWKSGDGNSTLREYLPAMSWAFGFKTELGGRKLQGYLPSLGEMMTIDLYRAVIDRILSMAGESMLGWDDGSWQTSTEISGRENWIWHRGYKRNVAKKTDGFAVLVLFSFVDEYDPITEILDLCPEEPLPLTYTGKGRFEETPDYQE